MESIQGINTVDDITYRIENCYYTQQSIECALSRVLNYGFSRQQPR